MSTKDIWKGRAKFIEKFNENFIIRNLANIFSLTLLTASSILNRRLPTLLMLSLAEWLFEIAIGMNNSISVRMLKLGLGLRILAFAFHAQPTKYMG